MDETIQRRDDAQSVPVRNKFKRRRCLLLLLLLLLLLTSIGVVTGILLNKANKYDSSASNQTNTDAELTATTIPTSSQNVTVDSTIYLQTSTTAELKTTTLLQSAQNMTIDPSASDQTYTAAKFNATTLPKLSQNVTTDSTTYLSTPTAAELKTTTLLESAQNMTIGSRGKRFIVLFTKSIILSTNNVYITSEHGVFINITTSPHLQTSLKSRIDQKRYIPSSYRIILPSALELSSFRKEVKSVLIETSSDVFVISHDEGDYSVGSTTHLPLHKLSTKYVVISTDPARSNPSQFAVSAIEDNTKISITFKMKGNIGLNIGATTYLNGGVFNFSLDRFETYQIEHMTDLSGTYIQSSVPITAFSGNDCNWLGNIGNCDHLIEQLPPIDSVDKIYIVPPNMDHRNTFIRIMAIENTNIAFTIGGFTWTQYIHKFDSFDTKITSSQICFIKSTKPILVTAFGLHSKTSTLGDPSMTIVPGINQYLDYYKIVVPSGYVSNYLSIMIRHSSTNSFRINGRIINKQDVVFQENVLVNNITYNVKSIRVVEGELTASTMNRDRFGLIFAGVNRDKAYGFSGNSMLP